MSSRMQRYDEGTETKKINSRTSRNQNLYDNLGSFEKYTNFGNVEKIEAVSLNDVKRNSNKREGYRVIRDYDFLEEKPKAKKELDEFNFLYQKDPNKAYDINTVLSEARKLREKDELERKRKLHNEDYNILESSEDELQKFKKEQELKHRPVENEKELKELINTITSKELREKIDQEREKSLLSDLMATGDIQDMVQPIDLKELEKSAKIPKKELKKEVEEKPIDKSFYTESIEIKTGDLNKGEEKKTPLGIRILSVLLSLLLIAAVGFAVYYIIMNF